MEKRYLLNAALALDDTLFVPSWLRPDVQTVVLLPEPESVVAEPLPYERLDVTEAEAELLRHWEGSLPDSHGG